jgi:hypothetical protein
MIRIEVIYEDEWENPSYAELVRMRLSLNLTCDLYARRGLLL